MPFWSENFGENASLNDPKRNFRFSVEFQGIQAAQGGAKLWYAKSCGKPSFAGNVTWEPITVTMVDPVDPDLTATLSAIVQGSGYTPPTDAETLTSISKAKSAAALGTVIITQLDSDGKPLETWTLWNSFITEVKYGDNLEYGNDDLTEISVSLRYDWARVETAGTSAATVGGGQEFFNV